MKTEKDFWQLEQQINSINFSSEDIDKRIAIGYPADPCVTLENVQPFEGQENYWELACFQLQAEAAARLDEVGIDYKKYGLTF